MTSTPDAGKPRTEDDVHGGLEVVLAAELHRYGLPPAAGLTGLLRHLYANQALTLGNYQQLTRLQQERLVGVRDLCVRAQREDDPTHRCADFAAAVLAQVTPRPATAQAAATDRS